MTDRNDYNAFLQKSLNLKNLLEILFEKLILTRINRLFFLPMELLF